MLWHEMRFCLRLRVRLMYMTFMTLMSINNKLPMIFWYHPAMVPTRIPNLKQTAPMRAATQRSRTAGCSANLEWSPHAWAYIMALSWPYHGHSKYAEIIWNHHPVDSGHPYFEAHPLIAWGFWDFDPTSKSRSDSSLKRCTRNSKFSQSRTNLAGSRLKSYKRLKKCWKLEQSVSQAYHGVS